MPPPSRKTLASLSFIDNLKSQKLNSWKSFQDSKTDTPQYRLRYEDGRLHLDGLRVATHNPVRAGFTLTITKLKDQKTIWKKLSFDFRTLSLAKNYGPQENNILIEIQKHNTTILNRKIFDGSDDQTLRKFATSRPYDSDWQRYEVDLGVKQIRKASKLTFNIYTLQNSFRPAKQIYLRNSYILRQAIDGEDFHHLPDDHPRKILPLPSP